MNVDEGIRYLIWKQTPSDPSVKDDITPQREKEPEFNPDVPPEDPGKSLKKSSRSAEKRSKESSKGVQIPTVMKEYVIVKKMLINNALPIAAGKLDIAKQSAYSHKLIIDKKILYNMMLDLQRFRKLLLLKKSFFIFQQSYDGKPEEHAGWHKKVEERITQTFMLMNMRRVINIIGYDPSNYFKGEMSFVNMEQIRKGNVPDMAPRTDGVLSSKSSPMKKPLPAGQKMDKMQSLYRHTNLNQNLKDVGQKYDVTSRQLKSLVDMLR